MAWSKVTDKNGTRYTAFVSDIEAYMVGLRLYPRCPVCKVRLTRSIWFYGKRVAEEPEALYDYIHECGARLILFND